MELSYHDRERLRYAKKILENPGAAARITHAIGAPLERGFNFLPDKWSETVRQAASGALHKALQIAVKSMDYKSRYGFGNGFHKTMVAFSGAGGGAFGLPALAVELPVSTTLMLRSIADTARSEGEQIQAAETRMACIEVFALGGATKKDDAAESGYFAIRTALARSVSEAAQHIARHGVAAKGAPAIVRFISNISARYGVTVSEKIAAQAVPVVGAAGGAMINLIFMDHFQSMARGHFIVRRLERVYGADRIRAEYEELTDYQRIDA